MPGDLAGHLTSSWFPIRWLVDPAFKDLRMHYVAVHGFVGKTSVTEPLVEDP